MSDQTVPEESGIPAAHWLPGAHLLTGKRRQIRLMLLAVLVGSATGIGAVVFYAATVIAARVALGGGAGYWPEPHPGGEKPFDWPAVPHHDLIPWLLLVIPAVGGLLSGLLV